MSLKRRIRRKFGISAPRVAVRAHVAWYWRWLFITIIVVLGILIADWLFDRMGAIAGWQRTGTLARLVQLEKETLLLERENSALQNQLGVARREGQIAAAAQASLTQTVTGLQSENAKLKEDLAFLQSLSAGGKTPGVSIGRVEVAPGRAPGEYSYSLWLLQSGPRTADFRGWVQFVAGVSEGGQKRMLNYPASPADAAYRVNVRVYQRLDGVLKLGATARLDSLQLRVFQDGVAAPRLIQDVALNK